MPFKSRSQLALCFQKKIRNESQGKKVTWDCDEWLEKTRNPLCLPYKKSDGKKKVEGCRRLKKNEKVTSPIYVGPKGGLYFFAKGLKIYVPKDAYSYVKKKYGVNKPN